MKGSGIIWIIDASYVLKGTSEKIDYIDMRRRLQQWAGGAFDRCIFFNTRVSGDERQEQFHQYLRDNHFDVRLYDIKEMRVHCRACGTLGSRQVQKGVDVGIATALLSERFKRVVLTAGDGDFEDAVRVLKEDFREVFVHCYRNSVSRSLTGYADKVLYEK